MDTEPAKRFGALEIFDGALWLGAPRTGLGEWGLRLGTESLSQWGGTGKQDTAWSSIREIDVQFVDPEKRTPLGKAARGVGLAIDLALAMAGGGTGGSTADGGVPNGTVRIEWVVANAWDRYWAQAAANWAPPLTPTERRAAEQLPRTMLRSERFRGNVGDPAALAALFDELRAAANVAAVDDVLRRAAGASI